jgi:hypothetical protein
VGDQILVEGTAMNNGQYEVGAIDGVNQSYLTINGGLHGGETITASVRSV